MTAIGMLSWQYLGMRPDDPAMVEGKYYLLQHLPDNGERSTYYWYYGTQAMHNLIGHEWDAWNRKMRKALVETQCREGCAAGSWDPKPDARCLERARGPDRHDGLLDPFAGSLLPLPAALQSARQPSDPPPGTIVPRDDEPQTE